MAESIYPIPVRHPQHGAGSLKPAEGFKDGWYLSVGSREIELIASDDEIEAWVAAYYPQGKPTALPRLFLHEDRRYLSVGFDDSEDSLLCLPETEAWRDIERIERWCAEVSAILEREAKRRAE